MKKEDLKKPYCTPMIVLSRIELEQMIAASVTVDSTATPGSEAVEDYQDGGSEWTSGDVSF